jgi:hypothetical protein
MTKQISRRDVLSGALGAAATAGLCPNSLAAPPQQRRSAIR